MSRYRYDYALAPERPTGWRSALSNVFLVSTIVAVSAISGVVVALDLLAPATPPEQPAIAAAVAPLHSPRISTPQLLQKMTAPTQQKAAVEVALPAVQPAAAPVAPAPVAAAPVAPAAQPAATTGAASEHAFAHVPESELTFSQGYARRRAVQAAADAAAGVKPDSARTEVARADARGQVERVATKTKKTRTHDRRWAEEPGWFGRSGQQRFDFGRHQALAYGDARDPRPSRRPPPSGGFFGGLF